MANLALLWAPWRDKFITRTPGRRACFFCAAKRSRADRRHRVVARGTQVFAVLNLYPYNNGHILIAPYRHVGKLEALAPAEWAESLRLCQQLMKRLKQTIKPHGFNLGVNLGRAAGAGVPGHFHLHVVPRWKGDTNFISTVGNAKVISQSLDELYTLLTAPRRRRAR